MAKLRSCWLWCLLIGLTGTPLLAQERSSPPPRGIPDGTTFLIRLEDKLDASRVQPGKRFKAKLIEDLVGPDETIIPHDSRIKGHVSEVGNGFHPRLLLSFDEIETTHGWVPLIATLTGVPGERGLKVPDEEGTIEREGNTRHRDPDSAGDTESGAARVGAAAGVVEAIFSDRRLQLQKGTTLEVRLDRPLQAAWR
ncbi:MAG TPA: hypothetical protein VHS34_12285 [Terriglobales bacterium]|jgi:hypothetical protein|nr:hypothetical protein [Terriglobales bacterium]